MYEGEKRKLKASIPDDVYDIIQEQKCFIAGGAITSLFTNREINDVDVYFRSKDHLKETLRLIFKETQFSLICTNYTDKSILFTTPGNPEDAVKVQFIHFRYFNSLEEVFDSFDFTVCMGGFDPVSEEFQFNDDFFKHNSQRYLKYNPKTDFPLLSALRVDKYKEKGYDISKPEFIRVVVNAAKVDIDSWETAKEHIGGVYGFDMDNLFDEEKEFSIDELLRQLGNVTASQIQTYKPSEGINYHELMYSVVGVEPRFYKYVVETEDGLFSRMSMGSNRLKYVVGETVNGGKNGVYCATPEMENHHLRVPRKDGVLLELESDGKNWKMCGNEVQLYGDVLVKRIADPAELEAQDE